MLNRGVADEDTIIPTMVFAKVAGGSPKYAALVEERLPAADIPRLMREARDQSADGAKDEYAGWDLVTILDGVPIVRIRPVALKLEDHAETTVLKRVEMQVISRHVGPETVREVYKRALRERDARWSKNNQGHVSYGFRGGFLSMRVTNGHEDLDATTVRSFSGDFFRHPAFHFPAPELVAGMYGCLLGSADDRNAHGFAYALDVYGKRRNKTPLRLILAFVAWHVGEGYDSKRPRTLIPNKQHIERFVDRHVIESLDAPPNNPWLSSRKAGEDAEQLAVERFVRLYAMASAPYQELVETPGF